MHLRHRCARQTHLAKPVSSGETGEAPSMFFSKPFAYAIGRSKCSRLAAGLITSGLVGLTACHAENGPTEDIQQLPRPERKPPQPPPVASCQCAAQTACWDGELLEPGAVLPVLEQTANQTVFASPPGQGLSLAWGNGHLWASDLFRGIIYELEPAPGGLTVLRAVEVKRDPFMQARDMAWDGTALWSVNWGEVIRHRTDDPQLGVDLVISDAVIEGRGPLLHHMRAVAFDGQKIWSALSGALYEHSSTDFSVKTVHQVDTIGSVAAMDFHDGDLWAANRAGGFVDRIDTTSFSTKARYSIVEQPFGLAWSSSNLWLYDWVTGHIVRVDELPDTSLDPRDVWFTGGQHTAPSSLESVSTTWSLADSPVVLKEGFDVPEDKTLVIEPGVQVLLNGPFTVHGTLIAEGNADAPIVMSHLRPNEMWSGLFFNGPANSDSVLKHVIVQYAQDGLRFESSVIQPIEGCTVRKVGVDGVWMTLGLGSYNPIEFIGNRIEQGAGVGIKIVLRDHRAEVPAIRIEQNSLAHFYAAAVIFESDDGMALTSPPEITVQHNIFEHGFRGVGAGFPGSGGATISNNYVGKSVSGSGIQPFHGDNLVTHNLIEFTLEHGYQLHTSHGVHDTRFEYNTVRAAGIDLNWGEPTIIVQHNNLLAPPWATRWIDAPEYDTTMVSNWWGTTDLTAIHDHIFDGYWLELNEPGSQEQRGDVLVEPILQGPNGIGFIRGRVLDGTGRPVSRIEVTVGDKVLHTAADGTYFTSATQGQHRVGIRSGRHAAADREVSVCAGESAEVLIQTQ